MKKETILYWIRRWNESGRIAFWYPRLHRISLNGGRRIPEAEAIKQIKECIKR